MVVNANKKCINFHKLVHRMINKYNYESKDIIKLPNPISNDRTHLRTSLVKSLLDVYDYNKNYKKNLLENALLKYEKIMTFLMTISV